jgi:hypothetical protein
MKNENNASLIFLPRRNKNVKNYIAGLLVYRITPRRVSFQGDCFLIWVGPGSLVIESAVEFEKFSSGAALQVDDALRGVELIITEVPLTPRLFF